MKQVLRPLLMLCLAATFLTHSPAQERKLAVVVGANAYRSNSGLPRLNHAANDAAALSQTLRDAGFTVYEMTHEVARQDGQETMAPLLAYIRDQIEGILQFSNLGPDDAVLISLHGHGVQFDRVDDDGKKTPNFYFCPADATVGELRTANEISDRNRLLSLDELYADLERCNAATKLLIVDACRNDPNASTVFRESLASSTLPKLPPPTGGTAAFFSCKANERAVEDATLKHGVFSHFLVKGLQGAADAKLQTGRPDGSITLLELANYVSNNTYAFVSTKYAGTRQTPNLMGEFDSDLVLAEINPRRLPGSPYDWPMFRGPDASGIAERGTPPTEWGGPEDQNIRWKARLPGAGPSSPIVVGDNVIVTSSALVDSDQESEDSEVDRFISCYDRLTGERKWENAVRGGDPFSSSAQRTDGMPTAATPDSSLVYCNLGSDGTRAYFLDGREAWHAPIDNINVNSWRGASPVLFENLLIVNAFSDNKTVFALDRVTGEQVWTWEVPEGDPGSFSATTPVVVAGFRSAHIFICDGRKTWYRIDAFSGDLVDRYSGNFFLSCATPVFHQENAVLLPGSETLVVDWEHNSVSGSFAAPKECQTKAICPVIANERLSGIQHTVMWSTSVDEMLNAGRGREPRVIRERAPFKKARASLITCNSFVYAVSVHEGTFVYQPSERGFGPVIAHNVIADDDSPFHGTPAISGRDLFLRSNNYLYCISEW